MLLCLKQKKQPRKEIFMALLPEVKKYYGEQKLFINGQWVKSKSTLLHENTNPATDEVISEFPTATREEARCR